MVVKSRSKTLLTPQQKQELQSLAVLNLQLSKNIMSIDLFTTTTNITKADINSNSLKKKNF